MIIFAPLFLIFIPFGSGSGASTLLMSLNIIYYLWLCVVYKITIPSKTLVLLTICFALLIFSLFVKGFDFFYTDQINSQLNYIGRVLSYFMLFVLVSSVVEHFCHGKSRFNIEYLAKLIFYIVCFGFLFEFFLKLFEWHEILEIYKARDLSDGGMSAYHYQRYSSFWAFPGDYGAIIVFSFSLILFCYRKIEGSFFMLAFLVMILFMTQSRAALIFFSVVLVLYACSRSVIISLSSVATTVVIIFFSLIYAEDLLLLFDHLGLHHLTRFVTDFSYYVQDSKRISEIYSLKEANISELIFGYKSSRMALFYESEILGSIARVGVMGSLWLCYFAWVGWSCSTNNNAPEFRLLTITFVSFIFVYCLSSAGFGRATIGSYFIFLLAYCRNMSFRSST
jgi:hypothetical protein